MAPRALRGCVAAVLLLAVGPARAAVTLGDRQFTITTPRLEATVRDGMVVRLKNRCTGEVHANPALADYILPRGLGHMGTDPKPMMALHSPWGNQQMNQDLPAAQPYPTMHRPGPNSRYRAARIPGGVRATWSGLTNGTAEFPRETLTLEAWVDQKTGQLLLKAVGTSPNGGVYGVQVPLANLHRDHTFTVPSFGGVRYGNTERPALITLGGAPFWEAPVVGIEGRRGSLGLWVEDDTFRPNFFFLTWSGKSFGVAIEALNLMPFERKTTIRSCTWHLDAFTGGWVEAMTPYKEWYARAFAPERKLRAGPRWADKIQVICDHLDPTDEVLRLLATTFDPETVLIHEWNARAPEFDHELPDWTPRAGYVERVRRLQRYGFRTMAYVNTYCVNVGSPVYVRDKVAEFALPRKKSGIWAYADPPQSLTTAQEGQLLYLDPLSPRWRRYHTDMMIRWRRETGTDANYEDVGGTAGDFGNGVVAGKAGAQGGTEQFRELLRRNPTVPMAAEYAPDNIAFAVRWPLRYQQVWGNEETRIWWMEHQRPVSAYIHGPQARAWVPVINAGSDFGRNVVVACSDALGGLGQVAATAAELRATTGMSYHMKRRAQLFAHRQLRPAFPKQRWEPSLACCYRDRDGRLYRYYATATVQQMVGPDGRPLYQRVTGLNQIDTPLTLPGWPAAREGKIIGLNPAVRYALHRGAHDRTQVQVTDLPAGIRVARYESTPQRTVLVLSAITENGPSSGRVVLRVHAPFTGAMLNDQPVALPPWNEQQQASGGARSYTVTFPAHFVFLAGEPAQPQIGEYFGDGRENGRYINVATGLERGGEFAIPYRPLFTVPGEAQPVPFLFLNYGSECEVAVDYLVRVPSPDAALRVYVQNRETRYGNGGIVRLYLNGRVAHALDLGPQPNPDWKEGDDPATRNRWDTDIHAWTVPLGKLAGQPLLVTLATDAKGDNNADHIWWARPKFIADPAQQARFERLSESGEVRNE
ncbi:MAG: hypothetical protein GX774_05120 [Armatimonadetes bacterium]|nr:hypothetical protein [Armatimonadota bacterium]